MSGSTKVLVLAAGAALAAMTAVSAPVRADDDPAYLALGAGTWETMRNTYRRPEVDLAYRSDYKLWIFKPHAGLLVAADGDYYGYAGLLVDVDWSPHFVSTLSTAAGRYGGGGFNLGSHFEFRSGIDLAYRFDDRSRLGVGFYHMSNAGLTQRNPGSESLLMLYSYPLEQLLTN